MSAEPRALPFGANVESGGVRFRVWSPGSDRVDVILETAGGDRAFPLEEEPHGYFSAFVEGASTGTRYRYRLDGGHSYPDPASRFQPQGVHGPSQVVDPYAFDWSDGEWRGVGLEDLVVYELHIGTFTVAGTFAAAAERMGDLADLGVTAIELMPVAEFAGERNWGYDGVDLYAPSSRYGGPEGLRLLVDAAHSAGVAVLLDVVYNHLGPEGNYLPAITHGHYLTSRHQTPWGDAINYDAAGSEHVRAFVVENARYWAREYHVDGLRLDATHAVLDDSPRHILREVTDALHAMPDRPRLVIAEDERNERQVVLPPEQGGWGMDGVWADDLHHQLRRLTAGDSEGYYAAYAGTAADVVETLRKGWFYEGQTRPDTGRPRGTPAADLWPPRFVHCLQNHDQVGNRAFGGRIHHQLSPALYRALSTLLLFSPYTPLLWMGQEWAASTPFLYFTDHPEELGRRVSEGRREEFGHFSAFRDEAIRATIPDPQDPETFARSRLDWSERDLEPHAGVLRLYREMLALRREQEALRTPDRGSWTVEALGEAGLALRRGRGDQVPLLLLLLFRGEIALPPGAFAAADLEAGRHWVPLLTSEELRFGGSGAWGRLEGDGSFHLVGPAAVVLRAT